MRKIRNRQLERAEKLVENPSSLNKKCPNNPKRFIRQNHCTSDGEIADKTILSIDEDVATEEERYDGFYAVCTNLEDDVAIMVFGMILAIETFSPSQVCSFSMGLPAASCLTIP